jgi:hypothetical protein
MNPGYPKQQIKKYHDGGRLKNRVRSLYSFNFYRGPTLATPLKHYHTKRLKGQARGRS